MMRAGSPNAHEQKKVREEEGWGARRVMGVIGGGEGRLAAPRRGRWERLRDGAGEGR